MPVPPDSPASQRPHLHYTARRHWVNDPNGLIYVNGVYHLYYQHNPHANAPGHLSWGHASSPDLLHWTEQAVALPERETHMIFSGSAVTDWHNSSGLGDGQRPPLVALYTGHTDAHPARLHLAQRHHQAQYLAYSLDGGESWRYGGESAVLDLDKSDFRDPKLLWDEAGGRWLMLLVHPDERQVEFYSSADLHVWTSLSVFGPAGELAGIWEVPEFFALSDAQGQRRWVLKVDFNPGGPHGGSGSQYWVGDFDGARFTPLTPARPLDWGKDFYAALSFSDLTARRVWLAWMNNWQYAQRLPTHPWRGSFSLPRELSLGPDWSLLQRPVPELETLREERAVLEGGAVSLELHPDKAHELRLSLRPAAELTLQLRSAGVGSAGSGSAGGVEAELRVEGGHLHLTRPAHPQVPDFGGSFAAPLPDAQAALDLHLIVDAGSLEVFAAGGAVVLTCLLLPAAPLQTLRLDAAAGAFSGEWCSLRPIWGRGEPQSS
ncbi:GH32 C-terminal domain-containing protein [Deinococcus sp.]|uniref:GH32 C-terminal domain-containing protein n=1 Tax=Deinococcus sp. TaxID=47478 RepID=UPI003CC55866